MVARPVVVVLALILALTLALTSALSSALVGPAVSARRDARADLRIPSGGVAVVSGSVTGTVTVRNRGLTAARSTRLAVAVGGVTQRFPVRRLAPGRQVRVPVSVDLGPGTYPVRACADARDVVSEVSERNNCRWLGTVVVPPSTPTSTVPSAPMSFQPGVPVLVGTAPYDYYVQVPAAYDPSHQTPMRLVAFLHGCYDTASNQLGSLRGAVALDSADYLLMVPRLGRDGACWDYAADPAVVRAALADLATHVNVAAGRTVLGGYSSGALLAGQVTLADVPSYAGLLVMMGSPFTGAANRDALLAGASGRLPVTWRAHTDDTTFPLDTVTADRDALVAAGFSVTSSTTSGTHLYDPADLAWLFARIG